jgi:ADP-ribose pyrophosphatase
MVAMALIQVAALEVVEDFTASARCDEGFLQIRRLRCRNRRPDGSSSPIYRVDVVDRPALDAVAVLVYRQRSDGVPGLEILTRLNLRPAAYFRRDKVPAIPEAPILQVPEIVAGVLEPTDRGEEGIRSRAAAEVSEEAGFEVTPAEIELLGAPYLPVPGVLSEKIYLSAVDVTGKPHGEPKGDGSPLEEGGALRWWSADEALEGCRSGQIPDGKTELALLRLASRKGLRLG